MVKTSPSEPSVQTDTLSDESRVSPNMARDENSADAPLEYVNVELLESIQNFVDDLSNVTGNKNFVDYRTIVHRIDETKVKAYTKLVNGFKVFFDNNADSLTKGDFEELKDPNISYVTENGSFSFNFHTMFHETDEENQDVIKDHLNHIWNILNKKNKSAEELYIDKILVDLKKRFSPDMTREEQLAIFKDLVNDFQKQSLDISIIIKTACQKARRLLLSSGSDNHKILTLLDDLEEIDINNFTMIQFITFVGKVGTLYANEENNPLSSLLSNMFQSNSFNMEHLSIDSCNDDPENNPQ